MESSLVENRDPTPGASNLKPGPGEARHLSRTTTRRPRLPERLLRTIQARTLPLEPPLRRSSFQPPVLTSRRMRAGELGIMRDIDSFCISALGAFPPPLPGNSFPHLKLRPPRPHFEGLAPTGVVPAGSQVGTWNPPVPPVVLRTGQGKSQGLPCVSIVTATCALRFEQRLGGRFRRYFPNPRI